MCENICHPIKSKVDKRQWNGLYCVSFDKRVRVKKCFVVWPSLITQNTAFVKKESTLYNDFMEWKTRRVNYMIKLCHICIDSFIWTQNCTKSCFLCSKISMMLSPRLWHIWKNRFIRIIPSVYTKMISCMLEI